MIRNRSFINIDSCGREFPEDVLVSFNLAVNDGDVHQYISNYIPMHWHKELEFFLLIEGEVKINIGDTPHFLKAGEGCFINSEVMHSFTAITPDICHYHSFVADQTIISGMPGSIYDTKYIRPLIQSGPEFLKFCPDSENQIFFEQFNAAFEACRQEFPEYEFYVRESLTKILLHIKRTTDFHNSRQIPAIHEIRLKQMLKYIDKNLADSISVKDIASSVNICTRECQRIFHHYVNYSPMNYLQQKRILKASEQLIYTDNSITEIAFSCGFFTPSYFSKQFKLYVGCTPREYRKKFKI